MNALAAQLQTYFTVFARAQRDLSENTIASYRDTWRMLLTFLATRTGARAERLDLADITAEAVTAFLDHLEHDRGNTTSTRNARLCAIRAVLSHAMIDHLEHAATISRVLAIPPKRTPKPMLEYLTPAEADALIAAPRPHHLDRATRPRPARPRDPDRATHQRTTLLTCTDIHLGTAANVTCTGKGRRNRATPLTTTTTAVITGYLTERAARPGTALFCGPHGQPLSRDALEHRLTKHAATAAKSCTALTDKHVTMHTLRHTAAMNLLAEGVDISVIALWLGHQRTQSTDAYLHADIAIKQAAIDRTRPPATEPGTFHPEHDILAWLTAL